MHGDLRYFSDVVLHFLANVVNSYGKNAKRHERAHRKPALRMVFSTVLLSQGNN